LRAENPGDLAVKFIENLTLVGDYAGQKFRLRDWQKDIVRPVFGMLEPDGRRTFRKVFCALPRKQAKTTLIAGMAGFCLFGEWKGKSGQRSYSASGDRDQASLIFDTLASMIRADPYLDKLCTIYDSYKEITVPSLDNVFKALSSEAGTKHGLSPSHIFFDELHVLPNRKLHDVLTTGFGARLEPLTVYISTAGHDRHSICWEVWDYARKVRDGLIDDPRFLPVLYETGPDEDWADEAVWRRVMPALGDFCSLEFIREECDKAKNIPAYENTFRQLYLNQWTEQAVRWLSAERWKSCGTLAPADVASLEGRECYAGLDVGVTGDMTAFAQVFPNHLGGLDVQCRFWAPEDGKWRQESRNADLYRLWHRLGFLVFTPGAAIDLGQVEREIAELHRRRPILALYADRAYATQILLSLYNTHGIPVEGIPQGPVTLNEPMQRLEGMLADGHLRHDGHPVLAWNVGNANAVKSTNGLVHLDKSSATNRIDGLAALLDAVKAWIALGCEGGPSVYETRGVLTL
jgi:phage terminase large subunit-like protein